LNKGSQHNTNAKEIADVRKVDIKVPSDGVNVVKDTQACDDAHEAKGKVNGLVN
jgi:hypothetical protein